MKSMKWPHNCSNCKYLFTKDEVDYYFCEAYHAKEAFLASTILARTGERPNEYISYPIDVLAQEGSNKFSVQEKLIYALALERGSCKGQAILRNKSIQFVIRQIAIYISISMMHGNPLQLPKDHNDLIDI